MNIREQDKRGRKFGETYSILLTDLSFERRLKQFDPNLRIKFNKLEKKWVVLEWAPDNSGYNILFKCEDDQGNPKGLGEWVFNKLYVMRNNYDHLRHVGANRFVDDAIYYEGKAEEKREVKEDQEARLKIKDDLNQWKRAIRGLRNLPTSDVTAGYPKRGIKHASFSSNL